MLIGNHDHIVAYLTAAVVVVWVVADLIRQARQ